MLLKRLSKLCISLIFGLGASSSFASLVVWDYSPVTTGGVVTSNNWTNQLGGQHFAEQVSFGSTTTIYGMDIYNAIGYGSLNDAAQVTIWNNAGTQPGSIIASFLTTVSAVDSVGAYAGEHRLHADISGFTMLANTNYWIGMAPTSGTWTQTGLTGVTGGDGFMAQFGGSSFQGMVPIGDMAFRLDGEASAVPEPASLALLGLVGLVASRRRKTT